MPGSQERFPSRGLAVFRSCHCHQLKGFGNAFRRGKGFEEDVLEGDAEGPLIDVLAGDPELALSFYRMVEDKDDATVLDALRIAVEMVNGNKDKKCG